jgi:hypothetical protein
MHPLLIAALTAAMPAAFAVQVLKVLLAKHLEPLMGSWRWNGVLRILSALVGGTWAWLFYGDAEHVAAGLGGGLACTAVLAGVFRLARTWSPTAPMDEGPPPDDPEVP